MSSDVGWGPDNPHPLSTRRTELVWEGKYDEFGRRREVDVAGCAMPLQMIETVDEPRARAEAQGLLWDQASAHPDDFRNMLIWGDNKLVMASLLKDFKGKIDLIYIDPPFDVGADFTMRVPVGDGKDALRKDQSVLEFVAYRDTWGKGMDSYLGMMYERLALARDLLSENGSIYVHVDRRVGPSTKLMMDEVFGEGRFVNEIVWCYTGPSSPGMRAFANKHDLIYWYANGDKWTFNCDEVRIPYAESTKRNEGRRTGWTTGDPDSVVRLNPLGKYPEDWWRLHVVAPASAERNGFPTQKPESLLERIIRASSTEGDLIADFFAGSGTTGAVAEKLGRRWIMCDLGRFGVHMSRKRLIEVQRGLHEQATPYRSFDVYNLGRYERQWWQQKWLQGADEEHRRVVLGFFKAEVLDSTPSPLLHGRKGRAFCHVDGIDSIFTRDEARAVAVATKQAGGEEVYCLAWEFEMDLRMLCNALESELGVRIKLVPIPREIMERNRAEPPPFLEVATLRAEPVYRKVGGKRVVDIKLVEFIPSLAEVPAKELEALKERATESGFDFIDFWAVDFRYEHGKPFKHHWQAYRTLKKRDLPTVSNQKHEYPKKGRYTACVKVVDIFGCDTSITVEVKV